MDASLLALGLGAYLWGQQSKPTTYAPTPPPPNLSPAATTTPPGVDVGALLAQYGPAALEIITNLTAAWARQSAQGASTPTVPVSTWSLPSNVA